MSSMNVSGAYEYVESIETPAVTPAPTVHVIVETVDGHRWLTPTPDSFGLFMSAKNAIRFAVTRDGAPSRPMSSRMLDTMMGSRDFAGLDGAAQAGMIMSMLAPVGPIQIAVLIASSAPRSVPCECRRPCCSGRKLNHYWRTAVDTLAHESARALPAGSKSSYALRSALLVKIYGGGQSFKHIADELKMDEETVSRQHRAILIWLQGAKAKKYSDAVEGIESIAWREAESILREHGIVR